MKFSTGSVAKIVIVGFIVTVSAYSLIVFLMYFYALNVLKSNFKFHTSPQHIHVCICIQSMFSALESDLKKKVTQGVTHSRGFDMQYPVCRGGFDTFQLSNPHLAPPIPLQGGGGA